MSIPRNKKALLASTIIAGLGGFATPAFAQGDTAGQAEDQAIVITGSRIARPNLEQSSPVSVVDSQEISLQQPASAEEFLRDLPGTVPGTTSNVNNGQGGLATFNLRGLGVNRNLVLLNERRVVPGALNGAVDLNIIPVGLIERVDVFTGGASSVYGADAIAGVVNFITRRDFSGVDMSANYGITERGDGATWRVDLILGANFDGGRGNAVLALSHVEIDPVYQGQRAVGTLARQSTTCSAANIAAGCNPAVNNVTIGFPQGSNTAVPASLFFPLPAPTAGGLGIGDINGRFDPATGTIVAGLSDYNFQPINVFQTPQDRYTIFGSARYEISDAIEVFAEALFSRTSVVQNIAPTGTFTEVLAIPLNNPFLTATQRTQLCEFAVASAASGAFGLPRGQVQPAGAVIPATNAQCPAAIASGTQISAIIARRFTETGARVTDFSARQFQVIGGMRGPLTSTLDWEIHGQYGETARVNTSTGTALTDRVQQALIATSTTTCANPAGGCFPANIFGAEGTLDQRALNFFGVPTTVFQNIEFASVQAQVSGDIGWAMPWATTPIGVALGLEYRRYAGLTFGDLPSSTAGAVLGSGGATLRTEGEYSSREAFAEINIPIVEDRPFFHNLSIEAGARYADYSTSGGNWTYKVGGGWAPIRDIRFRGLYSRAVRAPNIGELFAPVNTGLATLATDPCQGSIAAIQGRASAGLNGVALCQAQVQAAGLPASVVGSIPAPIASQVNATGGGNPNLDPEVATTITAGVVLQPRFLPGFSATIDWYRIRVRDAISSPGLSDTLNGCFLGTNPAFCANIQRNPQTGGLSGSAATTRGIVLATTNQGFFEVQGFDFGASYRRDLGFARLNLSFNGNHTQRSRARPTQASILRECTGFYSPSCDPPLPRWSWNSRATLGFGDTDVSMVWRHISSNRAEPVAPNPQLPLGTPTTSGPINVVTAYQRIPAYDYFDLAVQHSIGDHLRITFLVQNLFDRDPPSVGNTIGTTAQNSGGTYPSVYDTLGRRYLMGVNVRF